MAVHPGQSGVTAALEREMELPAELRYCRQPRNVRIGEQFRLQGTDAHPVDARH